jgi:hypothetical protein
LQNKSWEYQMTNGWQWYGTSPGYTTFLIV